MLTKYLDDLESRIDEAGEADLLEQWKHFADSEIESGIFYPQRRYTAPTKIEWPLITCNDAIADYDQMLVAQIAECSSTLCGDGAGRFMNVRANYGTCILSSVFGAEIFWMEDRLNTLPTSKPIPGGADAIKRLLEAGVPDLNTGFGARVFEMGRRYRAAFAPYPKISKWIAIYHPDIQGPMDIAELVWGSTIFYEFYDRPELVHDFVALVTETYSQFLREWQQIVPARDDGYAFHWGMLHKGTIMLRDDSAMNLSGEAFEEFIKPYDQRLLDEFGGGAVHFCGRGDHFIPSMCSMRNLHAINLSQPHLNDMESIYRHTVDKGISLIAFDRGHAERAQASGRDFKGRTQCWL